MHLYPYVGSLGLYSCPSSGFQPTEALVQPNYWSYLGAYGWNLNLFNTVVAVDAHPYNAAALPDGILWDRAKPAYRHSDMCNVLFSDGHVRALTRDALFATTPNIHGRKVAYLASAYGSGWTNDPSIRIFSLWQTAASLPHF